MKATPQSRNVRIALEPLEDRTVPAGNISASVTGGTLSIQADSYHHFFSVKVQDNGISLEVWQPTTINGVNYSKFESVLFPGDANVIQAMEITSSQGNDNISVVDMLTAPRDLNVTVRSGNATDILSLSGQGYFTGNINLFSEGGNDQVEVNGDLSDAALGVYLGTGDDSLKINGAIGSILSLDGGSGKKDALQLPNWVYQAFASSIRGFEKISRT